jgi:uncharacterized membrane protein YdbT with pleckstrin-like domain
VSYAEKHLIAGEQVQYETRLHWIVMLGHTVIALILVVLGVGLLVASQHNWQGADVVPPREALYIGAAIAFVLAAIFWIIGLVRRGATEMAVTNKRVIVKTGLANRRTLELLLPRIESVVVEEPAMGRMLGYGTVIVRGTGGTPEVFPQIAHPLQFREQVQRQIAGEGKPL